MDWVKPKHRVRDLNRKDSIESDMSAGAWLNQLCEDNVLLLQASLPIDNKKSKGSDEAPTIEDYVNALQWGAGVWETDFEESLPYLQEFVQALGTTHSRKKKKEQILLSPNQVAVSKKIGAWINQQLPRNGHDPYVALCSAGWIHALPNVGKDITPTLWLDVLQAIMTQVNRAWENGPESVSGGNSADALCPWLIWACEIPLALANQLSHLGGKDRIVSDALNRIAQLLEEAAEEPLPLLRYGGQDLKAILASVVRSRWAADALGARKWYPPQRKAITKLATWALSLTDPQGHQLLFDESVSQFEPEFWTSIYHLSGKSQKFANTLACALPDAIGKRLKLKAAKMRKDSTLDSSLTKHSVYWEKSCIATMRRSWRDHGCRLAIDFASDVIWLDVIGEDGERIFSGDWDVQIKRDGQELTIDHAWQEVCWFSDDDADYLELECSAGDDCTIQRQIMLVREEGMLYFADALLANEPNRWNIQTSWSLAPGVRFEPESKNTEGKLLRDTPELGTSKLVGLMLPVASPEWKRDNTNCWLTTREDTVIQHAEADTKRLYSPTVLPLRGLAKLQAYTWRRLTIAEELQIQPPEVAEAYRVQLNDEQWLFYRSLAPCTRRTVMGLHLNTEFYAGRFCSDDGQFEAILQVDQNASEEEV